MTTDDAGSQDIGNIVEFGHLNIRVPDQRLALVFYVEGLGLPRDPFERTGPDNAWINVGAGQFHLPTGAPQVVRGVVRLVLPDLDGLMVRLAGVAARLRGTAFAVERKAGRVSMRCPWGNRIDAEAPDVDRFGNTSLAIVGVEFAARPKTAAGIARFYAEVLGAKAGVDEDEDGYFARITAGPHGALVFRESKAGLAPYDGHHVQITVADFSGVHRRLLDRGLVTEESNRSQYRFEAIVDVVSGETLTTLEHEVRSMRHPMYGRLPAPRTA